MKKFTQWVDVIREAEERKQSELQKSYKEYFSAKLNKFGAKSPADLTAEQKAEFFNEIKKDWEKGSGAKPAGKKDVEEHGVKESEIENGLSDINEGKKEELTKKIDDVFSEIKAMNLPKDTELQFIRTSIGLGFLSILADPNAMSKFKLKSVNDKTKMKDASDKLAAAKSPEEIKSILLDQVNSLNESENDNSSDNINEAEVKNAKDFEEYAMTVLKKQHGDDFDEETAKKVIKDLSAEAEKDGDWGAAIGKLNA